MRPHVIRRATLFWMAMGAMSLLRAQAADEPVWTPRDGWLPVPEVRPAERIAGQEGGVALLAADSAAAVMGVRVVDERTRAPIAGAKLTRYRVSDDVLELRKPLQMMEASSGADGLVSLPMDSTEGWWVLTAEGYAPFQSEDVLPIEVELRPGRRVEARLLDPMGAPLAAADVVVFHGGEWPAPVLARARTDADGRLVLEHVDVVFGCYAVFGQPGVIGFINVGPRYRLSHLVGFGSRVREVALEPGIDVRGRILDERGAPLMGAVVGTPPGAHDGQAAPVRTSATGDFEILGVMHGSSLLGVHPAGGDDSVIDIRRVTGDTPVLVRVGPTGEPSDQAAGTSPVDVELQVPSGRSLGFVELRILREDGRSLTGRTERASGYEDVPLGTGRVNLPPGHYRVTTEDSFRRVAIPPTGFTVNAGEPSLVKVMGRPQPALRTVGLSHRELATLVIPGQSTGVDTELGALRGTFLPADVPAWVEWRGFRFPVGPEKDGERVATITPSPPTIVRWASDWPVDTAELLLDDRGAEADFYAFQQHLETYATGPAMLRVILDLQGKLNVPIDLPREVGGVVTVDLSPAYRARTPVASVRVRERDDGPPAGLRAWIDDGPPDGVFELYGPVEPFRARIPSRVRFEAPGLLPVLLTITEAREHVVAWGQATLALEVSGPDGAPIDAVASVNGHLLRVDAGRLTVGGLSEGSLALEVSPRATASLRALGTTISLGATETRRLQVRLPAR